MSRPASEHATFQPEIQKELDALKQDIIAADAEILKLHEKLFAPIHKKRDVVLSKVDGFWQQAIANCDPVSSYVDDEDWQVLAFLKEVKVVRSAEDPRGCSITFSFKDNKFLASNEITKKFVVKKDATAMGSQEFDWEQDLEPKKAEVQWKGDDVDLCKKNPVKLPTDDDMDTFEPGSFFSTFFECTHPSIASNIGQAIADSLYPDAADWYTGEADSGVDFFDDFDEEEDEEDEEDEDDAEEIDLEEDEKRASKKAKTSK
ncbi:unnamed protein product [Sympodiomycopsis kandeliae]